MSRPTEPKVRKIRSDLDKVVSKLRQTRMVATDMTVNPKGSDVEMCKEIRSAVEQLAEATELVAAASKILEGPERLLLNRRKK